MNKSRQAIEEILQKAVIDGVEFWRNEKVLPVPVGTIAHHSTTAIIEVIRGMLPDEIFDESTESKAWYTNGYAAGFNACLDTIESSLRGMEGR